MEIRGDAIRNRLIALHKTSYDHFTKRFSENVLAQGFISDKQLKLFEKLERNKEHTNSKIFSIDNNSDYLGNTYW